MWKGVRRNGISDRGYGHQHFHYTMTILVNKMYYNFKNNNNNKEFLNLKAKGQSFYPLKAFVVAILLDNRGVAKYDFSCVDMQIKKNHSEALFPLGLIVECSCLCVVGAVKCSFPPFAF